MKKVSAVSLAVFLVTFSLILILYQQIPTEHQDEKSSNIQPNFSSVHIPFIINVGQIDNHIKFYANTFGGTVYITETGDIFYRLINKGKDNTINGFTFKEQFVDSKEPAASGDSVADTKVNYFTGNNRSGWRSNIPTYEVVDLGNIYDGISVNLRAHGNNVEKIFRIQPGADPSDIRINISGVDSLNINKEGELILNSSAGNVSFTKPVAYQDLSGGRKYIEVVYNTEGNEYGFKVDSYDYTFPLIIDPLISSTFLGGSCDDICYGPFIETDDSGNVYLSGFTCTTTDFTTTGVYDTIYNGGILDCFVAKFNNDLTTLIACTYLGGSGSGTYETECSIALDEDGNIYAGGFTNSQDFPTTPGAYNRFNSGGYDIFISKLSNDLTTLLASTYIGGSDNDGYESNRIDLIVGESGDLYFVGQSRSTDFPTTPGTYDSTFNGFGFIGSGDAVVVKMNSNLSTLLASTYLGGSNDDYRVSLALDQNENVFVAFGTFSPNIPTDPGGGYDESYNGSADVFISKLSGDLTTQLAATYLGHSGEEVSHVVEIGENRNVYISGYTTSSDFPTSTGAYDESFNFGIEDGFISKFDSELEYLLASTFFGGSAADRIQALIINKGNVYVTGKTLSVDFPIISGTYDDDYNGGTEHGDIFVSKLDSNLTTLSASTYLGGSDDEKSFGIALDTSGYVFVGGFTHSQDYPFTTGTYDSTFAGIRDVIVAKLLLEPIVSVEEYENNPKEFSLFQNYPNPFNPSTKISFALPTQELVTIKVFDVLGNEVATLVNEEKPGGDYEINFNAVSLSSGIYFYKLQAGNFVHTKKMILMK